MKTPRTSHSKRGFTLLELMVAMAITTIIVTVLVSITSVAIDTWNRSRSELRAARQAKAFVDTMARDFEALVTRRGNDSEWLSAISPSTLPGKKLQSTNAAELIFFSGSTERYNGEIGGTLDKGGDVSCIGYRLVYDDPIKKGGEFETFILKRILVNPDDTFKELLGQKDLDTAFEPYAKKLDDIKNFVCENVFQFTVTFHVEVTSASGTGAGQIENRLVTISPSGGSTEFSIKGTGIEAPSADAALKAGRITAVGISLTVLSDAGIEQLRKRGFDEDEDKSEFLAKNSYQYSKLIQLPGM